MITFHQVTKFYPPDTCALKDIELHIDEGEFVSIVGKSGAGKTTLTKLLIAEERPTEGRIVVGDWDITDVRHGEVPLLRRQIGTVFQDFKLLPQKTVFENVAFSMEVCGTPSSVIRDTVGKVLEIVGLDGKGGKFPGSLSGGERQRTAIARSLAQQPKILIADEPTGNLDAVNSREIIGLLKKVNELGTTILLVTHNQEMVNMLKERVITLDSGMIVGDKEKSGYAL
jgi:cell division transport system ATP-binding protein